MKLKILSISILIFLNSCKKNNDHYSVDEFMNKVKSESYNDIFLPDFEPKDISSLLTYRNNKKQLKKYPRNPTSSFICDSVTVGIIALWTIESIRISELNGDTSEFNRFPSRNPMIKDTLKNYLDIFYLQDCASTEYFIWWYNRDLNITDKLKINPLKNSKLVWN